MTKTHRYYNDIPWYEKLAGRLLLFIYGFKSWDSITQEFDRNCEALIDHYIAIPPEKAVRQVKTQRLPFIEESSTNWSPVMIINHVVQAGTGFTYVQNSFKKDREFTQTIRTQDVKPPVIKDERATTTIIGLFDTFKREYMDVAKDEIISERTVKHPWFGEMDAKKWHTISCIHVALHTKQLLKILPKL